MRRALPWIAILLAWTLVAIIFAVSSSLTYALTYRPPQWGRTFVLALTEWYAWAILTPAVIWLARRLRLSRGRWMGRALALSAIALPIVVLKVTMTRTVRAAMHVREYFLVSNLFAHYAIFWGIVAIVHAVHYYAAERDRELRATQAEARLAEARLQVLRMQLHPHFLFNTLNAIAELVHEDAATAERMIAGLSGLLRETLDSGGTDLVPLAREIDLLRKYIAIQRERFGDRLHVTIEVAPEAMQTTVPLFILQPLVENAIRHGISTHRLAGHIVIHARRDGERLVMEVQDDGPGLDEERLRLGVGLTNTRERLLALYGESHIFEARAVSTGGTLIRIIIPAAAAEPTGDA